MSAEVNHANANHAEVDHANANYANANYANPSSQPGHWNADAREQLHSWRHAHQLAEWEWNPRIG